MTKDATKALEELDEWYRRCMLDNRKAGFTEAAKRWEHQRWALADLREKLGLPWKSTEN